MTRNNQYDVIIIGAGIAGIGCAAMLRPDLSVLILEREPHCGYHSTGRSAAIYIPSYGGVEIRELTRLSERYFSEAPDEPECGGYLQARGELLLAGPDDDEALNELLDSAPTLSEISLDEAIDWVPILDRAYLHRTAADKSARDIDVDLLMQTWRKMLARKPCTVLNDQEVMALQVSPANGKARRWTVSTRDQHYQATTVVNAAGAWADSVAGLAGIRPRDLIPCRRSAALIPAPAQHRVENWPAFAAVDESWYAKPMGGKLMVSPADEDPVEPHDAFAEDLTLAEGIDRYERAVTEAVVNVEQTWAGLRTFAPDRIPVVGFDVEAEGFFWLAGQGGYGIQTSPALSQLAAAMLADEAKINTNQRKLIKALSPARSMRA